MLALAALAARGEGDPDRALIEIQLASDPESVLRLVEEAQRRPIDTAEGLEYLRGRLLAEVDRQAEALQAYLSAMSTVPRLAAHSRFRLAEAQAALGRADVAAGLVATLLGGGPPRALEVPALRLLERVLEAGGDCRVLRSIGEDRLGGDGRRHLQLIRAACALRAGDRATAEDWVFALLEVQQGDDVARQGAALIAGGEVIRERTARAHMLLGLAFYSHRDFDLAIQHLSRAIARLPEASNISRAEAHEVRYALARSHFWQERFRVAAASFAALAADTRTPSLRAKALYQQGRSLELEEAWEPAVVVFDRAYRSEPGGGWASSALLSQLRLHWRSGRESEALAVLRRLQARRKATDLRRALLFLISSDLAQGRADRSGAWLQAAARLASGSAAAEVAYWSGRHAELRGDLDGAVADYLRVLEADPYDPFAAEARVRLGASPLDARAVRVGRELAKSNRPDELYGAWLLLGDDDEVGRASRQVLRARLDRDATVAPFLDLTPAPPETWPLLRQPPRQPEDLLLTLGLWQEGAPAVLRHFPVSEPRLAFTGSLMLARSGETRSSLLVAEVLDQRVPRRLPVALKPEGFRRLLYPFRFGYLILREADRHGVDPYLLAAIIREESRFDPKALSAAAARGLTQFVLPTARRLAPRVGLDRVVPEDLERPEIAIALGAAYLSELAGRFAGRVEQMVVGYNAGEAQAEAWRRYCFSDDPAELYTKVTFRETRGYLDKVLTSYGHYLELYGD